MPNPFDSLMSALGVKKRGPAPTDKNPVARVGGYRAPVGTPQDPSMARTMAGYEDSKPDSVYRAKPVRVGIKQIIAGVDSTISRLRHPRTPQ
jgi:hypothetical protein